MNRPSGSPPAINERDRCLKCNRSRATCFCGFVSPFETRTRILILMHPKEFKRQKVGTGRLTHLSLPNSEIVMGTDFTGNAKLKRILADPAYHPVLLYPGPGSVDIGREGALGVPDGRILLVLVLDATWTLAKKMMRLSTNLHSLPRVSISPKEPSRFHIKQQPRENCLSTIEAVHHLLDDLDRSGYERLEGRHAALLGVLAKIVEFQTRCASDPALPSYRFKKQYTSPADRKRTRKWDDRSLFFKK